MGVVFQESGFQLSLDFFQAHQLIFEIFLTCFMHKSKEIRIMCQQPVFQIFLRFGSDPNANWYCYGFFLFTHY